MLLKKFNRGINIGGYLSQFEFAARATDEQGLKEHFDTYIVAENIKQIADWGFDHVRIPVDGLFFFDRETKTLNDEPMRYLSRCMEWCAEYKLNVIIDLHNFWGHVYCQMDTPTALMSDREVREDFVLFWVRMAEAFVGYAKTELMFELFNEVADATGYQWNNLCRTTIEEIRKIDQKRWILIGTNYVNSVGYLDRLQLFEDEFVFYNFHYYQPCVFTHQKAHFSNELKLYNKSMNYPDDMTDYLEFLKEHPEFAAEHPLITSDMKRNDQELMIRLLKPAKDFTTYSGHGLMCTEYGVIDTAPEEEAVKWLKDFMMLCNEMQIGHTLWNYKCLDYGILDIDNKIVRPLIVELIKEMNVG